jgi:ABC-2 type transport system ATP-binding protein
MTPCAATPPGTSPAAPAIDVAGLSKSYGPQTVVADVSFQVPFGSVTGFLGPNGAGKSTTLRMLVGLTRPSAGRASVLGAPYSQLGNPGRRVGVLLDAAAQHAGRSGHEVLALGAMLIGLPERRVEQMIERVGLTPNEARRRTGTYSLGMRQRLGIAHALLGDPRVLILDEPANGLDPAGIHWMRGLLREFADAGGAVLLSSHLLHEIEVVADNLVVIGRGRIVIEGSKDELLTAVGTFARADDNDALASALRADGTLYSPSEGGYTVVADAGRVAHIAASAGLTLLELRPAGGGLEELFLSLTADDSREDHSA